MTAPSPTASTRLYFLDWVRIIAFMLLIGYHVGMYYVSWEWHVNSAPAITAVEPFMRLSSPWRLTLLFFVAGVASWFLLARLGRSSFLRLRSVRLLLPLAFGMLVVVPPQPYLEVVEKVSYAGSYTDFMRLYLTAYNGFCREDCLTLPTWNHLWFVAYLWTYTLILGLIALLLPLERLRAMGDAVARQLGGWKLIAIPVAILALERLTIMEHFPSTHALVDDWHNHATYLPVFLLGVLLARATQVWQDMEQLRWRALGLALLAWACMLLWSQAYEQAELQALVMPWLPLGRIMYALCTWSAIVAACGFARRHLNRDGAARRYLTEAVFPVYIMHQTLTVVLAHGFKPLKLAPGLEALLLVLLAAILSFAVFELVRRVPLLRPLFGLAPRAAPVPVPAAAPA